MTTALTIIFALMLLGAILWLLDDTAKEKAEAQQRAWKHNKKLLEEAEKETPWPVKTQAGQDVSEMESAKEDSGEN